MINKFLLIGAGGVTVVGTGAGVGIYYANQDNGKPKNKKPDQPAVSPSVPDSSDASEPSGSPKPEALKNQPGTFGK